MKPGFGPGKRCEGDPFDRMGLPSRTHLVTDACHRSIPVVHLYLWHLKFFAGRGIREVSNTLTKETVHTSCTVLLTEDTWLVEIRLGRSKWRIRELTRSIAAWFHFEDLMERHPHVTLYGPFEVPAAMSGRDVLAVIGDCARGYEPVSFTIDGWELRQGMHGSVIAFTVRPSDELQVLTRAISRALYPLTGSMNAWDGTPEKKWFHVTIANRMDPGVAERSFSLMNGTFQPPPGEPPGILGRITRLFRPEENEPHPPRFTPPLLDETGLRITVMRGQHIFAEYDFGENRWIMNGHEHDSISWQRTVQAYRYHAGLELQDPAGSPADAIFVISDLHLGHANIIRYCSRPFLFSDPGEMDHVLIKNWNYTVSPRTRVYHLGDLRYGRDAHPAGYYKKRLHGEITWISGNHDEDSGTTSVQLDYGGRQFLLIHDPADAPPDFPGWVIYGHHHNNNLNDYPYLDFVHRRINVSAEVIGYIPVSLDELSRTITRQEQSGILTPLLLRYHYVP